MSKATCEFQLNASSTWQIQPKVILGACTDRIITPSHIHSFTAGSVGIKILQNLFPDFFLPSPINLKEWEANKMYHRSYRNLSPNMRGRYVSTCGWLTKPTTKRTLRPITFPVFPPHSDTVSCPRP